MSKEADILRSALDRERMARKEAERILEEKSLELYELQRKLKIAKKAKPTTTDTSALQTDSVFSSLADAYLKIDLDGRILEMNTAAVELFGYDHRIESINVLDLVHRDDYSYAMASFQELAKRGAFTDFIARIYSGDGSTRLVHVNANIVYDAKNQPVAAEGIVRDITQESKVRQVVEEQRAELSTIVSNSPIGIVLTENGMIKKSNPAFQEMLGYSASELQRIDATELVHQKHFSEIMEIQSDMNAARSTHLEFEQTMIRKDRTEIKVKVNITTIFDERKQPRYRLSLVEDITKESIRKELIAEQQEQLEIIINNSPIGIGLSNDQGFTRVNSTFCELLGYSPKELGQISSLDVTHEEDLEVSRAMVNKMYNGEIDQFDLKNRYIRKDGSIMIAKTSVSAVRDALGHIKYQVVILDDITEQVQVERQKEELLARLERSNLDLHEYAHVVSHDLKSPLRSISSLVSWIREDCIDRSDQKGFQHLNLIENTVEKMESLINGILTYSSIERDTSDKTEVSMKEVVDNILKLLYVPDHVSIMVKSPLPNLMGDPIRFQQLFQNLIGNAISYMDKEKGEVIIDCESQGAYWVFSVKDNGMGIPKEYHEKIFGVFQSLNTSPKLNSTGIGLSIVKKIVDMYKGEVYLESEEGVGTTFFIKLKKT
ncbi:PAS domain S-box protein [Marinoscillum sp.]|uniref:PAS domain S-box protein n=1 Tax=Marinoscillum sp. TaxID=2024838 RepID=UPI003BA97CF5